MILNKIINRIKKIPQTIFTNYYSGKGERQAAVNHKDIRADHVGRYKLACRYVREQDLVMDCACGVGYGSHILSMETKAKKIISVDKEKKAISFAKKYYSANNIDYFNNDVFKVNLSEMLDCIISFETLEHVDGEKLIKSFYEKLKNKGLILISTPNQDTMPFSKEKFPFHLRHYTPQEFGALLENNGFKITHKYTQYNFNEETTHEGWDGLFNIAVAEKNER